ncbi:YbgI/family dinuclear metal center protein [Candidozyma haemuli]|uniref:YbgI/family dinuclear metal center protein n=1 Tax=Candidozyma haemuli TaxID=45357 RepID=A0A2V1AN79_9ASCO|nr:YbgI/family dinuclear metal center protein [[Candida] haemuloni]PVH18673.1 YbgI/family dinuclear metal center protein [[Candida] haemuloni]
MPSPTSKRAVLAATNAIQKLYPIRLADKSWDNTGLLVDSSSDFTESDSCKILLTIDLTQNVANEAIEKKSNMIVAYHPFIFRGLKSITSDDPQQRSLIRLIQNNISVYSPHTAVDSAKGGVNDFLADGIAQNLKVKSRSVIQPNPDEEGCGMGRFIELEEPAPLTSLVENVKDSQSLRHVQVGVGRNLKKDHSVKTIAICAGSGGSVFRGVEADLYYTGELSHHEALFFTEKGSSLIACNHSNTERAFLKVLKEQLQQELPEAEVEISAEDKDPYEVW